MTAALGQPRSGETPTGHPHAGMHGPDTGRHAAPSEATHGTMGTVPIDMRSRDAHAVTPQSPSPLAAPSALAAPLSRAARTAGLSLAALGALAGAGGVATGQIVTAADEPMPTGEFALPTDLAAADMTLASSGGALQAVDAATTTAPAVMPSVMPVSSSTVSPVSSATPAAAPEVKTSSPALRAAERQEREERAESERAAEAEKAEQAQASSGGSEVVQLAKNQVGTPYVWGGTSTSGFDCSGLVQWAYEKAGKDLPRTSAAQSQVGEKVSRDELQPGDLIFMYSPVSHVAMYAGDGQIVEAPQSGDNVRVTDLDRYDGKITGMRRV